MLDPAGPAARSIATLWWVMLIGAVLIFTLVMALLAAAFHPGRRQIRESSHEQLWIVQLGIVFSIIVLAVLLGFGLSAGERLLPKTTENLVNVQAQAQRWQWRFTYADRPGHATDNVLHIPAGRPVDVAITSADVVHSFWVPRLAGKLDAIPGHVNTLRISADEPGRYAGRTSEFNGAGYRKHSFTVVAHNARDWRAFVAGEQP